LHATPWARLTLEQWIDHVVQQKVNRAASKQSFRAEMQRWVGADAGRQLLGLITQNLGAEWTADFLGADTARIGAHVLKHLQQRYDKPHNQIKSLAELVYDDWRGSRDPRFPRGMRVMARSQLQDRPSANPDYDAQWFPARIIGVGMTPTTYELLFDARLDGDEEDRHDRTFPFLAKKADKAFLEGKVIGSGSKMIKPHICDYEWNTKLRVPQRARRCAATGNLGVDDMLCNVYTCTY